MDLAVATSDQRQSAGGSSAGLEALYAGLARRLADEHANDNLVFSPLSIYTSLALVAAGARGATLDEILRFLGARSRQELDEFVARTAGGALRDWSGSGGPRVAFACGVWSDLSCPLKPGFRDAVVNSAYKADASSIDFRGDPEGACRLINAWAERVTKGLIKNVLSPELVDPLTRVVLGNAVYFKGEWEQPFRKGNTKNAPFRLPGRRRRRRRALYAELAASVYRRARRFQGAQTWHLPPRKVDVGDFWVPRFKLSFHNSVVDALKKLGLQLPFNQEAADLSDMTEQAGLAVGQVIHKAVIEVNEEGTDAAAFNMSIKAPKKARVRPPRVDFVADHAFAYIIVEEKTGAVVFAGHVLDPSRE
ncbi:unnamed protein product [Alopecurus aequalis]